MPDRRRVYPKRPPRLGLVFLRPFYFVTFNTHERAPVLATRDIHDLFRRFCLRANREHDIAVGRYVIMPDHAHLFVALPRGEMRLDSWIRALKTVLGKQLLLSGRPKPHWQEGFFDHLLRSSESYSRKWDYVRLNPVRAGLCQTPDAWPYQGEMTHLPYS